MKQIFTITFLLLTITLSAQKAKMAKANEAFEKENYETCIPIYLEILDKKDISQAKINLAESYRKIDNWNEAEYWYGQIVHLPEAKPIYSLYYGMALQANEKCDLAIEYFAEYSRLVPDDWRGQLLTQACKQDIRGFTIRLCKNCYEIEPFPLNSKADDYSPTIYKNQLVFASGNNVLDNRRSCITHNYWEANFLTTSIDTLDAVNYEYIYDSTLSMFFPKMQKSIGASVFINHNEMYGTEIIERDDEPTRLKIVQGNLVKNEWQFKDDFPFNSDKYFVAHPTFTSSGDTIYFASDMPGGFGGMDLYYSILNNGNWSKPVSLGHTINTEGHEVFPFYHQSTNKLYFSSDGQMPTKGGLDIYCTRIGFGSQSVVHLDSPINTQDNDHGLILNEAGTFGYFSSNRAGGIGQDDIYAVRIRQVNFKITVADKETLALIENVTLTAPLSSNSNYTFKTNYAGSVSISLGLDDCTTFTISAKGYKTMENKVCTFEEMVNSNQEILILLEKE